MPHTNALTGDLPALTDSFDISLLQLMDGFKEFKVIPLPYSREIPRAGQFGYCRKYNTIVRVIRTGNHIEAYGVYKGRVLYIKRLLENTTGPNAILPIKDCREPSVGLHKYTHCVHVNYLGTDYMTKHVSQYNAERHMMAIKNYHGIVPVVSVLEYSTLSLRNPNG